MPLTLLHKSPKNRSSAPSIGNMQVAPWGGFPVAGHAPEPFFKYQFVHSRAWRRYLTLVKLSKCFLDLKFLSSVMSNTSGHPMTKDAPFILHFGVQRWSMAQAKEIMSEEYSWSVRSSTQKNFRPCRVVSLACVGSSPGALLARISRSTPAMLACQ
jgi:hypothetical protein